MRSVLTPTAIAAALKTAASGSRRVLNDPTCPGLHLRVGPRGGVWAWLGRDAHGRVRRFGLGRHPHIGLAEARRRARALADEVRRGADPVAEARARRALQNAPSGHTLGDLISLYGKQVGAAKKSWPSTERAARHLFRPHLQVPLANLTLGMLQMTIDEYPKPKAARFGYECLRAVLRWAAAPGRAYIAPAMLGLTSSAPKGKRDRVLTRDELAALLPVLHDRGAHDVHAAAHEFVLLTLARRSEVAAARWAAIDLEAGTWTLPATKNGKPHVVPLSRQAMGLLRARNGGVARDPGAHVFTRPEGGPLISWQSATRRFQAASHTSDWTRHDLRRTGATLLGELGVLPDIVEAALNHITIHSQIASIYNKSRYRPQVREALQKLADVLDGTEQGGAEIVPLPVTTA